MKAYYYQVALLLVFALTSISTYAQITVEKESANVETIPIMLLPGDVRALSSGNEGVIKLRKYDLVMDDGTKTSSYGLVVVSSNRFDNFFRLDLGKNKNECIQSLEALLNLIETMKKGDIKTINSGNDKINLTLRSVLGGKYLVLSSNGYAGTANVERRSLNKCLNYFKELEEK